MDENKDSYLLTLKKRESPKDYMDGFLAGLEAAKAGIERSIADFKMLKDFR
jgi:hypothetical protein